jgi:hypothetical protein
VDGLSGEHRLPVPKFNSSITEAQAFRFILASDHLRDKLHRTSTVVTVAIQAVNGASSWLARHTSHCLALAASFESPPEPD